MREALGVELDELIEDEWRGGEPIKPKRATRGGLASDGQASRRVAAAWTVRGDP